MDAAKRLPALSQALLTAAADVATSRQELARIQAQTAAALEATYGAVTARANGKASSASSQSDVLRQIVDTQPAPAIVAANDIAADDIQGLRDETAQLRKDMTAGLAAIAANTGKTAKTLEAVTEASGGSAVAVGVAA